MALIHTELFKFNTMKIIWLFQQESATISQNVNISSSQYIISTIKLIRVDYTLHKAKRLMIVDSEWMNHDHEQAKKRMNCIDQKASTYTYSLQCVRSEVKKIIYDRQNWRTHLVWQTLKPKTFVQDTYTKEVSDDVDDDLNYIDIKDLIREDLVV